MLLRNYLLTHSLNVSPGDMIKQKLGVALLPVYFFKSSLFSLSLCNVYISAHPDIHVAKTYENKLDFKKYMRHETMISHFVLMC